MFENKAKILFIASY